MSSLSVTVQTIDEVLPHPDADRLSVLVIGGHQTCAAKHNVGTQAAPDWQCPYHLGQAVIYVPPDAVLPDGVAEGWGVAPYLGSGNRVKTVKLRGFVSRGFVVPAEAINGRMPEPGTDVAAWYGIVKYEPPQPVSDELEPEIDGFTQYTDIERLQNFPRVLRDGEGVVVTEKLHGTNSRVASILVDGEPVVVCGTRHRQVRRGIGSKYETPLQLPQVHDLLVGSRNEHPEATSIVLFGEIIGPTVQKHFGYGMAAGCGHRAFDIAIDGEYVNWHRFLHICATYGVEPVPELYRGPFRLRMIEELSDGPSTIDGQHVREGVVVKPLRERSDPALGRVILKRIGDSYEVKQYQWTDSH